MELPFTMKQKRPGKMRMDATMQGSVMVQAFNGTEGFMIAPWTGSTDPQDINEDQVKQFKEMADMNGKLYDYKKKGSTLELIGSEEMEGTDVYKLKLTEKTEKEAEDGDVTYFFIDSESFVILKQTAKRKMQGNEFESETYLSNYKQVNEIALPHSMETKINGTTQSQITFEEVKFNEEMADDMFERPIKEEGK